MGYTGLATKVYKDPITVVWANSIKENFDQIDATRAMSAWVHFNATGSITSVDSFNIQSITQSGTGRYTVVFTSALTNGYCMAFAARDAQAGDMLYGGPATATLTTSVGFSFVLENKNGTKGDGGPCTVMVIGRGGPES